MPVIILVLFMAGTVSSAFAQTPEQRISELNDLIAQRESEGIDVQKEKMTVRTAEIFLKYANVDEANKSINKDFFTAQYPFPRVGTPNAPLVRPTVEKLAEDLPDILRNDVLSILDDAIDRLNGLLEPTVDAPKAVPIVDWANLNISGNRILNNGKPVFLLDHNFKPFDPELTEYYGALDLFSINLEQVIETSSGLDIRAGLVNGINSRPTNGNMGYFFINQTVLPDFVRTGTTDPTSPYFGLMTDHPTFTKFDVDHPQARVINRTLLSRVAELSKGKNITQLGYLLTNEPHWFTAEDSFDIVSISTYTKDKFVDWLIAKHNDVATLNSIWRESNISIQEAVNAFPFPVPKSLKGTSKWYDWMTFNQKRITDWFTFMDQAIKTEDPDAKTHVKLIPAQWSADNDHDHGLDFEALTQMTDIIGNDAGSVDSILFGDINNQDWVDKYGFNWRDSSMPYDFMTSVSPNNLVFNSEAHYISRNAFRDLNLKPNYVRTAHWLAYLHGLSIAQNWVWYRNADGTYQRKLFDRDLTTGNFDVFNRQKSKGYSGSLMQLPKVLNEVTATVMDLSAYSDDISALQDVEKSLRIFYSETSAINGPNYMTNIFDLYENLYFEGSPIGFATEKIIKNQPNNNWEAILIHKTVRVKNDEFDAVQTYLDNGGVVIIDNVSLKENEYGASRGRILSAGKGRIINSPTLEGMKNRAFEILGDKNKLPPLIVEEVNGMGEKGVFWRAYTRGDENIISLVNVGKEEATITLSLRGSTDEVNIKDLLIGEELNASTFVMESETIRFLKVKKGETLTNNNQDNIFNNVRLYPNPVRDLLTINFKNVFKKMNVKIYDLLGKKIFTNIHMNSTKINLNMKEYSKGLYIIKLSDEEQEYTFKLIKG
ncbi:T9SS type A sorting domain-containing protein [Aquimarina aggregata]|uniref:T9SS type A sorting domain-containing protein n=1 Tax=Aquimarina aggregata TaxID=1642818 RepID=UPI0024900014|nr:T9SS type A sorting domain-containing protein [Aquimarina aggregata]